MIIYGNGGSFAYATESFFPRKIVLNLVLKTKKQKRSCGLLRIRQARSFVALPRLHSCVKQPFFFSLLSKLLFENVLLG